MSPAPGTAQLTDGEDMPRWRPARDLRPGDGLFRVEVAAGDRCDPPSQLDIVYLVELPGGQALDKADTSAPAAWQRVEAAKSVLYAPASWTPGEVAATLAALRA